MSSRDQRRSEHSDFDPVAPDRDGRHPGKSSRTQALQRKAGPEPWHPSLAQPRDAAPDAFASVLFDVQRPADGNGVHEGAEQVVASAASGTGAPLPEPQREKFEASLGADLSGVRLHTEQPSQSAAAAVGARAYTLGQDVHFGAGFYQPESPAGEHLLAHEVAHTVQQSGGAAAPMFKLDVSTPNDPAEHEADRAADAMVTGSRFAVTSSGGLARQLRRDEYAEIDQPDGSRKLSPGDYYLKPGLNWTTMATAPGPVIDQPAETLKLDNIAPSKPIGGQWDPVDWCEANNMIPGWLWHNYWNFELTTVLRMTETAHGVMARAIKGYNNAKDEVKDGGLLGPAPTGENWAPAKNGASSIADLANEQTVGTKTKVGDLFTKDGGGSTTDLQGVDANALNSGTDAEKVKVSKLLEAARLKDGEVGVATNQYALHFSNDLTSAALGITKAGNDIALAKANDDDKNAQAAVAAAEADKAQIKAGVASAIGAFKWIAEAVTKPEDKAKEVAAIMAGEIAEEIFGGKYDVTIQQAKQHMDDVKSKIAGLTDGNLKIAYQQAQLAYEKIDAELPGKLLAVQTALRARHDAYKDAAEAAGQKTAGKTPSKAGAEQAERIQAAIEAIPRIDTVIGRAEAVISSIGLPPYNETAGVSLNVALYNANGDQYAAKMFLQEVATINAYKAKYQVIKQEWTDRKQSINTMISKLNVQGT